MLNKTDDFLFGFSEMSAFCAATASPKKVIEKYGFRIGSRLAPNIKCAVWKPVGETYKLVGSRLATQSKLVGYKASKIVGKVSCNNFNWGKNLRIKFQQTLGRDPKLFVLASSHCVTFELCGIIVWDFKFGDITNSIILTSIPIASNLRRVTEICNRIKNRLFGQTRRKLAHLCIKDEGEFFESDWSPQNHAQSSKI